MADIELTRPHTLGKDGARQAVERVARDLEQTLHFKQRWQGDTLHVQRTGAEGRIDVRDDAVQVIIELGFLLKSMRGQVRREAERLLDRHLKGGRPTTDG